MTEEIEGQMKNGNWEITHQSKVPQGIPTVPAVWTMRRKERFQ